MRILVVAICLLLAGCGGKSDRAKVTIANIGPGLQTYCLPIILGQSLGYFNEEGLDVNVEYLPSSAKAMQALVGGSVNVAGLMYQQNIQLAAEGQHVRSFFVMTRRDTRVLLVAPAASERIRRVEDLKGATIGIGTFGSPSHLWLISILARHGLGTADFKTVKIGFGASGSAAIEKGVVEAFTTSGGDHFLLLERYPSMRVLADTSTTEGMRETYGADEYAGGTVSARQDWLDRNPDAPRQLARALLRAQKWMAVHSPEEIRARLPEGFRSANASIDAKSIQASLASFTVAGAMPKGAPETVKRMLDEAVDNVRTAKIDLAATWTDEYLPGVK